MFDSRKNQQRLSNVPGRALISKLNQTRDNSYYRRGKHIHFLNSANVDSLARSTAMISPDLASIPRRHTQPDKSILAGDLSPSRMYLDLGLLYTVNGRKAKLYNNDTIALGCA
ncbi:hypothetical protein I7I51_02307 [Histoplasma capsulatum]|uniref:Uncharacterized protein n=1 Tax=Ajellomyces capsulatus TaxID=5037 RepID=A0A8A1M9E2_AJECA|nr:hypothetical protein I7I51_02307 [Histoplasma capsulatum]